jgi:hypothetical protein
MEKQYLNTENNNGKLVYKIPAIYSLKTGVVSYLLEDQNKSSDLHTYT